MNYEISTAADSTAVAVSGEITFREHAKFKPLVEELLNTDRRHYIVDLSHVDAIDSAGLGLMLILRKETQSKDADLTLKGANDVVHHALINAKFDTMFAIVP